MITVNDIPISCPFIVKDDTSGHILHMHDANDNGDISPDVATRSVTDVSIYDGFILITVR